MRSLGSWAVAVYCALSSSAVFAQGNDSETLILSDTSTKAGEKTNGDARTLAQLVEDALARNRQIRIDEARIAEAKALYQLAASQAYPRISGQALFGGPTPERRLTNENDINSVTDASKEGDFDFGSLGFTFRAQAEGALPLYTFGKISAAKDAARAVERAAEHKVNITEAEVVMNIHRAFWAYQLTRSFVDSLKDGEKTLEKVLGKIEALLDADSGQVTENDRLRMLHALATVRVKKNEAQYANDLSLAALKLLSGREQTDSLTVAYADLDEMPSQLPNLADYVAAAQEERPELRALRALIDAHQKFEDYRRNNFWPDFFLGGIFRYAYTSNSTDVKNPFAADDANFIDVGAGLGLRVQLDVFTKLAELEQAQAAKVTRTREVEAVAQVVDLEVRKIHHDLENGYQRISLLERANRAARGWLTASTLAYDVGTGDAAELIDSFLAWAASEGELQKTRYDMQLAHADLARSAGKLVGYRGRSERQNP